MHGKMISFRGALAMVASTGCYVASDTLMKLSTADLPPYEALAVRGISATIWGVLLLSFLRQWKAAPEFFNRWVSIRNSLELAAVLCYIVALANLPIANVISLLQITPLVMLIGAALVFKEYLSRLSMVLISLGFIGALMVAQPTTAGLSLFSLLALATAVLSGLRDLAGRRVPRNIPGLSVAFGACVLVLFGALFMHLVLEETVMPSIHHLWFLSMSGLFLFAGHYLLFMAYRFGPTVVVAPLYYLVTFWALIAGGVVFETIPNALAIAGIAIVVVSGVAIVILGPSHIKHVNKSGVQIE